MTKTPVDNSLITEQKTCTQTCTDSHTPVQVVHVIPKKVPTRTCTKPANSAGSARLPRKGSRKDLHQKGQTVQVSAGSKTNLHCPKKPRQINKPTHSTRRSAGYFHLTFLHETKPKTNTHDLNIDTNLHYLHSNLWTTTQHNTTTDPATFQTKTRAGAQK